MTLLKFDNRHSLTFFDANGPQNLFPFNEGDEIVLNLFMDKFEAFDEILTEVSPNAIWASHLYPEGSNENYDRETGTILLDVASVKDSKRKHGLRWRVDHKDTLLAVATADNENDVFTKLPNQMEIKVIMNLLVKEISRIDYLPESNAVEWYAKLVPSGKREAHLVVSEVMLQ